MYLYTFLPSWANHWILCNKKSEKCVKCRTVCSALPFETLSGRRHYRKSLLENVHDVLRLSDTGYFNVLSTTLCFHLIVSSFLIHSPTTIHLSPQGYSKLSQWGSQTIVFGHFFVFLSSVVLGTLTSFISSKDTSV